jgi:hypothetical protein
MTSPALPRWSILFPAYWLCACPDAIDAHHKADVKKCVKCRAQRPEKNERRGFEMSDNKCGEYMNLYWDGDPAEEEMVRGWPGEKATREAVESFYCNDSTRSWSFRQCWAMNVQTDRSRSMDIAYEVRLYNQPGRGRYKVSVLRRQK